MNIQNNLHKVKSFDRKKFFSRIGKGFIGLVIFSSLPFNMFNKNDSRFHKKVKVRINPLAVKREKDINNNV